MLGIPRWYRLARAADAVADSSYVIPPTGERCFVILNAVTSGNAAKDLGQLRALARSRYRILGPRSASALDCAVTIIFESEH